MEITESPSTINVEPLNKEESPGPQELSKKKKQKVIEMALKDLPPGATDEQRLQVVCEKLRESQQEQKALNSKIKQFEQLLKAIKQERDVLQNERNRLILQKDKLETLCRELQKQNKVIQEESLARARAEDEKRREVADHFQTSITSIQTQLNEYQNRNTELRKENQDLADKLGQFIQQHEKREEHIQKMMQARDLEVKLAEAKLNKAQCQLDQERIKSQQKITRMEEEAKLMQERMDMHTNLENKLKEQIEFYKNKYKSFNKTMADSNKMFDSAKTEMEKLGKRVRQAERDVVEWRGKWELSQRSLLELVDEHKKKIEEAAASKQKADCLAGLCRALQAQLTELRQSTSAPDTEIGQDNPTAQKQDDTTSVNECQTNRVIPKQKPVTSDVVAEFTGFEDADSTQPPNLKPVPEQDEFPGSSGTLDAQEKPIVKHADEVTPVGDPHNPDSTSSS